MVNIYNLSLVDIENLLINQGRKKYHAKQIWQGLYRHLYTTWDQFTSLSKDLREYFTLNYEIGCLNEINISRTKDESTVKSLFQLPDKLLLETVLLRKHDRLTLCVSTQSGCPVGCKFCATGKLGFFRSLLTAEIIEQVIYYQRLLNIENKKITNIVFMGMGEPFLNYTNLMNSISILNHKDGLYIGARRITVSTIGIVEKILAFADEETQVNLSVSLHAPTDELRRSLIPIAEKSTLTDLINACIYYFNKTGRRLTFEYVLISGVNDEPCHAHQLANLISRLNCHVNLIPLNPTEHYDKSAPSQTAIREFGKILLENKITLSFRESQGYEIAAGCGQLAGRQ